jgi:serine/threonine protein kinase
MTTEHWSRLQELFQLALDCDPIDREACLSAACRGDDELRGEVESLLTSERGAHAFLDSAVNAAMDSYGHQAGSPGPAFGVTDRFVIQDRLGAGGFGTVYRTFDLKRGTTVALKTLHHLDSQSLLGFKREFRALADISHPNVITLYELISDEEQCFFTMELVDGLNFREYVQRPDQLGTALPQLVQGLAALHAAGKLHRDLKPSNVLVTKEGRVVILDFGLVTNATGDDLCEREATAGTPAYMSPEQHAGLPSSEASDWYSVGIMLQEVLTGCPNAPQDLRELCSDLLQQDPRDRPSGPQICDRLGVTQFVGGATRKAPFVGREEHLRALSEAFNLSKAGCAVSVHIHGSSGIGKSALARRFLELVQESKDVVVLAGRCYERESVPYKAIDGLIDALSIHLKSLSIDVLDQLLPEIPAVARMFPVLREFTSRDFQKGHHAIDLQEQRQRGFRALRVLLAQLASYKPVILFIDDLQWGDSDSATLVAELLRPPDPPNILLIGCYRTEETNTSPFLRTLSSLQSGLLLPSTVQLALGDLSHPEARQLASALLGTPDDARTAGADKVVRQAGGNPFFVSELAQYTDSQSGLLRAGESDVPTLDDLVRVRLSGLPERARGILELVAVAGRPIDSHVLKQACGDSADDRALLATLSTGRLIRIRTTNDGQEIETYHDRIREKVTASLAESLTRDLHLRLGRAMENSPRSQPELLATHFAAAGCCQEAIRYAIVAGDEAATTLAFDSAARFYRMALQLQTVDDDDKLAIRRKLGDALSNAGRGAEAAEAYFAAAGVVGRSNALEDLRRAARQYLVSGHVDEGKAVLETLLSAIGMKQGSSPRHALISMLLSRARINLRGLHFAERAPAEVAQQDLIRIDTCFSVAQGLGFIDTIHAADFQARHILLALRAGEKYRVARALSVEAAYHGLGGTRRRERTQRVLHTAIELSRTCDDPYAQAFSTLIAGTCAFLEGRWKEAQLSFARAETALLEHCVGAFWDLATARLQSCASLFFLGKLNELRQRLPALLADADMRGDLYQATALRTRLAHVGPLAAGYPEEAMAILRDAIAKWSVQGFHVQHWWSLISQSEVLLYQCRGIDAWDFIAKQWPALQRSMLLRAQYFGIESLHHRACSALAAASDSTLSGARKRDFLQVASRDAASIERQNAPWGAAVALLIRAGITGIQGNQKVAVRLLSSAEAGFDLTDMRLYAAVARRHRGGLIQGDEGTALVKTADLWMADQGIQSPKSFAAMVAPGAWGQ